MTKNKQAFTLIELLVVVLIIGILAAVAVPQYQKSILKSRFASLKTLTNSIAQAEELYWLENGFYTNQWAGLSFGIEQNKVSEDVNCTLSVSVLEEVGTNAFVGCTMTRGNLKYEIVLNHSDHQPGKRSCIVRGTKDKSDWRNTICQAETGKKDGIVSSSESGYIVYHY